MERTYMKDECRVESREVNENEMKGKLKQTTA